MTHYENYLLIKSLCVQIVETQKTEDIVKLGKIIREKKSWGLLQNLQTDLLATLYVVLKKEAGNGSDLKVDDKLIVIEILETLLSHINLGKKLVFFNLFGYLISQIYDSNIHKIRNVPEEYKLAIITCTKALLNCTTTELTEELYMKENGNKLCKMIYVVVEIATTEKFRSLRIEAIECLMALFKVSNESDYSDLLFRSLVAECFSYFLPGVCSCLRNVTLTDDKVGFKLIQISIRAMGRIVSLLMQDYKEIFKVSSLQRVLACMNKKPPEPDLKCDKLEDYMKDVRNIEWFQKADRYLARLLQGYRKLTQHPIVGVRKELAEMCCLILEKCSTTCQLSSRYLVEILMILSEDEESEIRRISSVTLDGLRDHLVGNQIQDGFFETYTEIPAIFNGIDDKQKVAILRLVTGYLNLLQQNVHYNNNFKQLMHILLHLCEFQVDISTLAENIQDLESEDFPTSRNKNLKFLNNDDVRKEFSKLCNCLTRYHFEILLDFLLTTHEEIEERKEATYFLNELIKGLTDGNKLTLLKPIFRLYIENWDYTNDNSSLNNVGNNIQQASLYVEGVGIIAEVLGNEFKQFLMHCLFHVLTRAGSEHLVIQISGKEALKKICRALNYSDISSLIHNNMDYISMYIEKNLRHDNTDVLSVMEVLFKYSTKETLENILIVMEEISDRSCKFHEGNVDFYLRIFRAFLKCQRILFEIRATSPIFKTKAQKQEELLENFQIGGLDEKIDDFHDDFSGKTAEEMYKEDLEREREEIEPEVEGYKKVESPKYVQITVGILKTSLNFLPSKHEARKLLVLEILKDGLEIIKDYEDDLLPIVHLIWSPLVSRFKDTHVVINYSFQLLICLAKVSKDFIRNRTLKDVLPNILDVLTKLSKESYMKDKGSAYRYTQSYKLQLIILENLAYILCDIDLLNEEIMSVMLVYLNAKQPIPLQHAAVNFFKLLIKYEPSHRTTLENRKIEEECAKNLEKILED